MAVQAQYPSNALFLTRNGQESHDCSLPTQPGAFLDQSQMLHSNGGGISTPRKRGREEIATPVNHFPMNQSHPSQIIELSQLHTHINNGVSTGLRLSFGDQKKQDYHSSSFSSLFSEDFASLVNQQREEIEEFLHSQAEELRRKLAEQRKKHYRALLSAAAESVTRKLAEKEVEVERATRRNAEYEARVAQLSMEAQVWRARAKAQESTAAKLQAELQKAIVSGGAQDKRGGGGGTGQECAEGEAEDAESGYIDPVRKTVPDPKCKGCRNRTATVVLLPCRHLCVCRDCERLVRACPLCLAQTDFSVEVHLS